MDSNLVRALCAVASFILPLGVAWSIVAMGEWWRAHRRPGNPGKKGTP
jgi:hypothetical protein